jgi:hypothetical protein
MIEQAFGSETGCDKDAAAPKVSEFIGTEPLLLDWLFRF